MPLLEARFTHHLTMISTSPFDMPSTGKVHMARLQPCKARLAEPAPRSAWARLPSTSTQHALPSATACALRRTRSTQHNTPPLQHSRSLAGCQAGGTLSAAHVTLCSTPRCSLTAPPLPAAWVPACPHCAGSSRQGHHCTGWEGQQTGRSATTRSEPARQ